ncbi:MAG: F0F1 ATP synthase subunit B [Candidatus Margulisiibacteriota bacterium]
MLEFEFGLIFWTAISFGILLVLLYKVALPPLLHVMDERKEYIARSIKSADESKRVADEMQASYGKKLEDAENHATSIVERARKEAEKLRSNMVKNAEDEVRQLRKLTELEARAEKKKIMIEVEKESSELIVSAAQKVLGRVLTQQDRERIIKEGINEIKGI